MASHVGTLNHGVDGVGSIECACGEVFPAVQQVEPDHYESPGWVAHIKELSTNG